MLVLVNVPVDVGVRVLVGVKVDVEVLVTVTVRVPVVVGVDDLVAVPNNVKVGDGVIAVTDCVAVKLAVAVDVSVAKIPMGTTVGGPPISARGVRIDSFQAGGVSISCLTGSTTSNCCFTYSSSGFRLELTSAWTLQLGSMAIADCPAHNIKTIPINRISKNIHQSRLSRSGFFSLVVNQTHH